MARRNREEQQAERVVFAKSFIVPSKTVKTIRPPRHPNYKCCGK